MLVANFYHLKNTNGLFYYGADYICGDLKLLRKVLVRPALKDAATRFFPGVEITVCDPFRLAIEAFQVAIRGDFLYTPSSHPLPFLSNQMVVVHDVFPFLGWIGRLKRSLLCVSLFSSRCRVGYINNSDARPFVQGLGINEYRQIFAPNKFPSFLKWVPKQRVDKNARVTVGLLGTDSAKKNYPALFDALSAAGKSGSVDFILYGHPTQYYQELVRKFPQINAQLLESDKYSIDEFFSQIDIIVSVADNEGFGRPIAAALSAGVPCLLLDRPVFLEFFQGAAQFSPNIGTLIGKIIEFQTAPEKDPVAYVHPISVVSAYRETVDYLKDQASVDS